MRRERDFTAERFRRSMQRKKSTWEASTFGRQGEWAQARVLEVEFQHIKGNDIGQFRDVCTQVVVSPPEYKSGDVIYPYANAK
jgi:hypothetical protein